MREYNEGFSLFMGLSGNTHYLVMASEILCRDLQFENLQDRLVMGLVLPYQGYGKKIDDKAKKEILKKSLEMEKS